MRRRYIDCCGRTRGCSRCVLAFRAHTVRALFYLQLSDCTFALWAMFTRWLFRAAVQTVGAARD